ILHHVLRRCSGAARNKNVSEQVELIGDVDGTSCNVHSWVGPFVLTLGTRSHCEVWGTRMSLCATAARFTDRTACCTADWPCSACRCADIANRQLDLSKRQIIRGRVDPELRVGHIQATMHGINRQILLVE